MDPLRPGDRSQVGPYRLLRRLGGGGMGEVFLGESPGGRRVVVKLIRPDRASDPGFRRRPEAQAGIVIRRRAVLAGGLGVAAPAGITTAWLSSRSGRRNGTTGGAGAGTLDRITKDKTIRVGFANEAPYGFRDDSATLTGEGRIPICSPPSTSG